MGKMNLKSRFERHCDVMAEALGHAGRATPARWCLRGLMLPGPRISVEPMAARVHPHDVRSAHQPIHRLVADSEWNDKASLAAMVREIAPAAVFIPSRFDEDPDLRALSVAVRKIGGPGR